MLSNVIRVIARRAGTFFDQSTGALSGYDKGVLIANTAWTAWSTPVLLLSWYVPATPLCFSFLFIFHFRVSL
jgi:hypothetical protein